MTRLLSQLLQADELHFRQMLDRLEQLSHHPNIDIQMSSELQQLQRAKISQLGLDADDTTGPELYAALGERLKQDEQLFRATLQTTDADIVAQVARHLQPLTNQAPVYALKAAVARDQLRANPPRRLMKLLGYRSLESMLKHEPAAVLAVAAGLVELPAWHKRQAGHITKLGSSDFESRPLALDQPDASRWQTFAESTVSLHKQHVLPAPLYGAVVLLPLPATRPPSAALSTTVLTLRSINDVRALSAYWKLHQLQPDFIKTVQESLRAAPQAEAPHGPVAWQTIQQLVSRADFVLKDSLFQPLLTGEELAWAAIEDILAGLEPGLNFWRQTAHLGTFKDRVVSFNIADLLLSHINQLPYAQALTQHFQQALHSELLVRYLGSDAMRQPLLDKLSNHLAFEMETS